MGRGKPAFWSTLLGIPFVVAGAWLYLGQQEYPPITGLPFAGFGIFIIVIGLYVHHVEPEALRTGDSENLVATRHPTQRVAIIKVTVGIPLLVATLYLLYFTMVPYVYPSVTLIIGLYTFSVGLHTYWTNSLTTYYLTTDRVLKEYRFLSLVRQEIPRQKIRGVQERKSFTEALVGLGNVIVASGGGRSLEIQMRNMERSGAFSDEVRKVIGD